MVDRTGTPERYGEEEHPDRAVSLQWAEHMALAQGCAACCKTTLAP